MQITPANMYKFLLYKYGIRILLDKNWSYFKLMGRNYFTSVPKNSDVLFFEPLSKHYVSESFVSSYNTTRVKYFTDINSSNFIANAMGMYLYRYYYDAYDYLHVVYDSFAEELTSKVVSSIFNTTTYPTTSAGFLEYSTEQLGTSDAKVNVALLGGWTYNQNKHSSRAVHYLLKIVTGGGLNTAQFIWTKLPYTPEDFPYYKPNATSFYTEGLPLYLSGTSILAYRYYDPNRSHDGYLYTLSCDGIHAESRRKDPTIKDVYIFLVVRSDKRKVEVFETPFELLQERIFEYTADFDIKQATWFNGRIILVSDTDPYSLYLLDLDSTLTHIADTTISQGSPVLLVSHPDQDVCYLFGENEQWILYSDLTHETTTFDLTGLVNFNHLQFDIDGNVWFDGSKRDKNLLTELLNVPNARCNYTYVAVNNGDGTYKAYLLDGTTQINNLPDEALAPLFYSGVAYRYPQKVLVPYNETDLTLLNTNGDLTSLNWYGWDGTQWVPYDGSNPRTIDATQIELEDGVQLNFDFTNGDFVQDEYIYFTVAEGMIKDALSSFELKKVYDLRYWEYHYVDISIVTPTVTDNGNGTYSYFVPESSDATFWELDTFLMVATFDDPEQNGSGVDAEIITSGSPEVGQVYVDTNTGEIKFNQADYGRTFQVHYYVVRDVDCPFV